MAKNKRIHDFPLSFLLKILFLSMFSACVSAPQPNQEKNYEKEFKATFEEVWRASQQAMISYPLKVNNMEQGLIQTTALKNSVQFKSPIDTKVHAGGHRYDITVSIIKLTEKSTQVKIQKTMQNYRDFISQPEEKISDGMEEQVLLYRISREIEVDRAIVNQSKPKKN